MKCDKLSLQIDNWFDGHRQEMLDSLAALVAIPSVAGKAQGSMPYGKNSYDALKAAGGILEHCQFDVKYYDNCVLSADLNANKSALAMLAHVDVVPEGDGWDTPPFTLTEKNGAFYGRGASDDKGPAVAAIFAMAAARDIAPELSKSCRIIIGSAEETGMSDLSHYEKYESYPPMVFSPDSDFPIITTEKGRLSPEFKCSWIESSVLPRIVYARGGSVSNIVPRESEALIEGLTAKEAQPICAEYAKESGGHITCRDTNGGVVITAHGVASHASLPASGVNSNTLLIGALSRLPIAECEGFYRLGRLSALIPHGDTSGMAMGIHCKDEISGEITVNFGIFSYDITGMTGKLDIRTPVCADDMPIAQMVAASFGRCGIPCDSSDVLPSHHVSEDSEFVQTLLRLYEEYTGLPGAALAVGGLTYVHSIPGGVAFGCTLPGHDPCMHGANEHILPDEFFTSAKIFTRAIIELCK